ncbi:MAG: hypothetical protein FJW39_25600 [Acidobacteria bacterium]|nr:hypothetical protein [Acidobacteriota bacterium]
MIVGHEQEDEANLIHPLGEREVSVDEGAQAVQAGVTLDTFAGKVHVKWVPEEAVSSLGQMAFFVEF